MWVVCVGREKAAIRGIGPDRFRVKPGVMVLAHDPSAWGGDRTSRLQVIISHIENETSCHMEGHGEARWPPSGGEESHCKDHPLSQSTAIFSSSGPVHRRSAAAECVACE